MIVVNILSQYLYIKNSVTAQESQHNVMMAVFVYSEEVNVKGKITDAFKIIFT